MNFKKWLLVENVDNTVLDQAKRPGFFLAYIGSGSPRRWWTGNYDRRADRPIIELSVNKPGKIIDVEFATVHHPELRPALTSLLTVLPWLSDFSMTFDGAKVGSVQDVLARQEDPDWIVRWFYHGTAGYYAQLAFHEGLKPRSLTNIVASFVGGSRESNPDLVYLSADDGNDVRFAAREANRKSGRPGVATILKIDATKLNPARLTPDEDSESSSWKESLYRTGTVGYRGTIRPELISVHLVLGKNGWGHEL